MLKSRISATLTLCSSLPQQRGGDDGEGKPGGVCCVFGGESPPSGAEQPAGWAAPLSATSQNCLHTRLPSTLRACPNWDRRSRSGGFYQSDTARGKINHLRGHPSWSALFLFYLNTYLQQSQFSWDPAAHWHFSQGNSLSQPEVFGTELRFEVRICVCSSVSKCLQLKCVWGKTKKDHSLNPPRVVVVFFFF